MMSRRVSRFLPVLSAAVLSVATPVLAATPSDAPTVNIASGLPGNGTFDAATVPAVADPAPKPVRHVSRLRLQTIDTTALTAPLSDGRGAHLHTAVPVVMEARATAMRPAPMPDQDVDAPGPDAQTIASQQQASLAPSFYGNKDHFSGDGFSNGSNLESDKNNRRRPGGGMSLSIPVQ